MIEEPIYDVIIVDEGQDFRENWLELDSLTCSTLGETEFGR